jgi:hypothetical protein
MYGQCTLRVGEWKPSIDKMSFNVEYNVIVHCWVQYCILSDEYTADKPILDEELVGSDIGIAVMYKSNRINICLYNNALFI